MGFKIRYVKTYTAEECRKAPNDIFVFGDNTVGKGKAPGAGQAVIRDEPNAFGVPTKVAPSNAASSFFSDKEEEIELVKSRLRELFKLGRQGKTLVFPEEGIGTGRAKMAEKSPKAFALMMDILENHFGVEFKKKPKRSTSSPSDSMEP